MKLLYIDLFCGAGGTSTGVNSARFNGEQCAKVIACVNHDKNAIASHAANHPDALHFTEDIRTLELSPLVSHVEKCKIENPDAHIVLWASLECTNFSKAKGGLPRDADSRTLAEHLFRYIDAIQPDYIQIENVEEFMSWGPLDEHGKPLSKSKGEFYVRWVAKVCSYGYRFDYRILNAADYGAVTSRKRFFGIFAKDGLPIEFPSQTHSKTPNSSMKPWRAVRSALDFADKGNSIFGRKKPLVDASLRRIYAGLIKFVAGGKENFLLKYNSMNNAGKYVAPDIDDPCPTVCTQNRLGIASVSFLSKAYSGSPMSKNISVEEPSGAITTIDHHQFVSVCYGNGFVKSVNDPCPTLTTKDRCALITPSFIVSQYSGGGQLSDCNAPCPAITTTPKQNIVNCEIVSKYFLMNPQYASPGGSIDAPCFTLIARMDKMPPYLVEASHSGVPHSFIAQTDQGLVYHIYDSDSEPMKQIKEFMALYGIVDIKIRMLKVSELKKIMGFPEDYILIGNQQEQKKYIGNAVEVNVARAWCEALVGAIDRNKHAA